MRKLVAVSFVGLIGIAACSPLPPVVKRGDLPHGSEVAVIMLRDCTIAGQVDCDGSGNSAGSTFARVLASSAKFKAVPVSRPVGPKEALSDDAAVAFAKDKGYRFILNGEVDEYYRVAPMTFRTERAGVSVRVLNVADGSVVAFFSDRRHSQTNFTTPDAMIEEMAKHVRDSL